VGEEKINGSPHTTKTEATGTFDFRMDLGDLFAIVDYVEQSGGSTLMAGHGVIGWSPKEKTYTLHWFDTFGSPPSVPGKGKWAIEMPVDGKGMTPIIVGKYRRANADAESSRRASLNRIV
jgi:hypothetical protein